LAIDKWFGARALTMCACRRRYNIDVRRCFIMSTSTILFGAMLLTNLTYAVSVVYGLRARQAAPGSRPAAGFLIALTIWLFGRLMEDAAPDITGKVFWARVEYFGIATVPVFWLLFGLEYTRRLRFPWPPVTWLLFVVPVLTMLAAWTNDAHGLLWYAIAPSGSDPNILVYTHGVWFYVALVHNYVLVVLGSFAIVRHALTRNAPHRSESLLLAIGACLPLAANLVYVLGLSPIKGFDLTPFGLTLAVMLWSTSKLRERVLDIVPARDALLGHLKDGAIIIDDLGNITDMNPAARTLLGVTDVNPDLTWAALMRDKLALRESGSAQGVLRAEVELPGDGASRFVAVVASPVYERGRFVGRIALLHDISERKRGERRIQELNATLERQVAERTHELAHTVIELKSEVGDRRNAEAALHQLSNRLATIQETERAAFARELHDQVGANLSALGMNLSLVKTLLPAHTPPDAFGRLTDSNALLIETTEIVRGIMSELRPPLLDDYGLLSALRWLAGQWRARTRIDVDVRGVEPMCKLPAETGIALYRIAQEALNNIARHADATRVEIALNCDAHEGQIQLSICDNGVGFAPAGVSKPATGSQTGWGMGTMRERARSVGGTLMIDSGAGRGTTVCARVPLEQERSKNDD
jgi:PAS domain S-box-containing protein